MEPLIEGALSRVLKEAPRRDADLRTACEEAIKTLRARRDEGIRDDDDAARYFRPFQLAASHTNAKIRSVALDAMQKLIAWGYLKGFSRVDSAAKRLLIDDVIDVIAASRSFPYPGVQLQVIKALLTAISSNTCHVRGEALLTAVGSIFHVHLESRSMDNKRTAAGTLQQAVGIVFQRMEVWDQRKQAGLPPPPHAALLPPPDDSAASTKATHKAAVDAAEAEAAAAKASKPEEAKEPEASDDADSSAESSSAESSAEATSHEGTPPSASASSSSSSPPAGADAEPEAADPFPSQYHRDAHAVLRALCAISDRGFQDASDDGSGSGKSAHAHGVLVESKILSLQLLHEILASSGHAFHSCPPFLQAVKQDLADTLLRNLLAPQPQVVSLALRIFLQLLRSSGFRPHLSEEIEVFVEEVFLALLDSPTASFDLRHALLQVIEALAKDKTAFIELFANMDCVDGRQDLVQRVADTLAAIAQGRASAVFNATQRTAEQAAAVQHQALSGILAMVHTVREAVDETTQAQALPAASGGADAKKEDDADDDGWPADEEDAGEDDGPHSGASSSTSSSSAAAAGARGGRDSLAGRFEATRREKAVLERAAIKFRMKPKTGIAFLRKIGRIDDTPESVARCFHDLKDVLDKTNMGEFLGGEKAFNVAVMHAYVDMLDFAGLPFEEGIRRFLDGFRLPGEAQKIDRMMEKFAERYLKQNPQSVFPDADCAFVLAYSVIMLNTDLHNPNILPERKMTLDGFVRNNRGVVNGQDFPREFLERVYHTIKENPISLKELDEMRARQTAKAAGGSVKARQEAMMAERRDILKRTSRSLAKRRQRVGGAAPASSASSSAAAATSSSSSSSTATTAGSAATGTEASMTSGAGGDGDEEAGGSGSTFRHWGADLADLLGPMLSTLWGPFTAAVSVLLERSDDGRVVEGCLSGIRSFIAAAGRLGLDTERDAVVSALSKFTRLGISGPLTPKNVLACRALVNTAVEDGESLGSSWVTVLHCLSQLAKLHVEAKGAREDAAFFPDHSSRPITGQAAAHGIGDQYHSRLSAQQAAEAAAVERRNAAMVQASIPEGRIDRVYVRSAQLSADAVVHFVRALCAVSMAELRLSASGSGIGGGAGPATAAAGSFGAGPSSPRVFSLQKVVECADYNMGVRSRVTWSHLWSALSSFFSLVGSHSNTALAMFAIDSLKQLSLKFLAKRELGAFHFQRMFLSPFSAIMDAQPRASPEIRELILHVFRVLVRSRHQQLQSGWSTVFRVHASAAREPSDPRTGEPSGMLLLAFETIDWVVRLHTQAVAGAGALEELSHCLVAFATNPYAPNDLSVRAVDHLVHVGAMLARGMLPTGDADDERVAAALEAIAGSPVMLGTASSDGGVDGGASAAAALSPEEEEEHARRLVAQAWDGIAVPEGASFDDTLLVDVRREAHLDEAAEAIPDGRPPSAASPGGDGDGHDAAAAAHDAAAAGGGESDSASPPSTEGASPPSPPASGPSPPCGLVRRFSDKPAHTAAWWPILTGLMRTVADRRYPVRTRALDALFAVLRRFGCGFDDALWSLVHSGVLLPIFDDVRHASTRGGGGGTVTSAGGAPSGDRQSVAQAAAVSAGAGTRGRKTGVATGEESAGEEALVMGGGEDDAYAASSAPSVVSVGSGPSAVPGSLSGSTAGSTSGGLDHSWLKTTCMPALTALVRLHAHSFRRLHPLLPNLLSLLEACADQEIEGLARIGVACFFVLLNEAGPRFGYTPWAQVIDSLRRLFASTRPRAIMDCREYLLGGPDTFSDDEEEDEEEDGEEEEGAEAAPTPLVSPFLPPPRGAPVLTRYGRAAMGATREDGTWELSMCGGTLYCPAGGSVIGEIVMGRAGEQVRALRPATALAAGAAAHGDHHHHHRRASVEDDAPRPLPFNSVRVVTQCVVQVELIETVSAMAERGNLERLPLPLLVKVLDELEAAAQFARAFNADRPLRRALWRSGFMRFARNNRLPSLLRQETSASKCLIRAVRGLLLAGKALKEEAGSSSTAPSLSSHASGPEAKAEGLRRLRALTKAAVWRFTRMAKEYEAATSAVGAASEHLAHEAGPESTEKKLEREGEAFSPVVVSTLSLVEGMVDEEFRAALPWLWPQMGDLVEYGSRSVRALVARMMRDRVTPLVPMLQGGDATTEG